MDDEFEADPELLAALVASEAAVSRTPRPQGHNQQPVPHKIIQPAPQRLDKRPPAKEGNASSSSGPKIVQPTPQALPNRSSGSAIQVSPRQKGNPVLGSLKSVPWEYSDIPADYLLGLTTCALFLSLKYHRLHPEYIYTRIRNLQGKYTLRIILTMVDIPNHEDALKELSKTSLVNNVTLILCWSAQEAARYLELYKTLEHTGPAAIKGRPPAGYGERVVEFVTVPKGINKTDAVSLVSAFGTLRNAVNADPDALAGLPGWGQRKVRKWTQAVEEPFRAKKAARRTAPSTDSVPLRDMAAMDKRSTETPSSPPSSSGRYHTPTLATKDHEEITLQPIAEESSHMTRDQIGRDASLAAGSSGSDPVTASSAQSEYRLSEGVAAALARLRQKG